MRTNLTMVAVLAGVVVMGAGAVAARGDMIPVQSYFNSGNQPYAYLDSGNEMTDGAWSTTGINPVDPWVGYSSAHAQLDFDLGENAPQVGGAMVVFCNWTGAAVYLPERVEFRFSDDPTFATFTSREYLTPFDGLPGAETVERMYDFSLLPAARYVRLNADSQFQWLFMGEVQFSSVPGVGSLAGLGVGMVMVGVGGRRRR